MTVLESDNITSTISYLRKNVYSQFKFRAEFISSFSEIFNANGFRFHCDQYGGLNIDMDFDSSKFNNDISESLSDQYSFYLNKTVKALQNVIDKLGEHVTITPNLVNMTLVGIDTIIIRI